MPPASKVMIVVLAIVSGTRTTSADEPTASDDEEPEWGTYEPGRGYAVATTKRGSMSISAYMLFRYLDQLGNDTFTNQVGGEVPVLRRRDIELQRTFVYLTGFLLDPKLRYNIVHWSALAVQQGSIIGTVTYEAHEAFALSAGVSGLPGTRSMQAVAPFFHGTDRQMADEFFRPGATTGIWASGQVRDLTYTVMVGNNLNQVGVVASQLSRELAKSVTVAWMPTTGEFGPRGGFGDFEMHEDVATRFGASFTHSRENRQDQLGAGGPENQAIRLSDSTLAFREGALAPGVTLQEASFWLVAADAGLKYMGLHLQGEYFYRRLTNLVADGPLPLSTIVDHGFFVQASYQAWRRRLGVYAVSSVVFGESNVSWEAGGGASFYPYESRDVRLNLHSHYVDKAPAGNLFGYYVGGQTGTTVSLACELMF